MHMNAHTCVEKGAGVSIKSAKLLVAKFSEEIGYVRLAVLI